MSNPIRLAAGLAAISALALTVAALGTVPSAEAAAKKRCNIRGDERKFGPTYVSSLKVRRVRCRTGRAVVRAYYHCRIRSGSLRGRCHSKVLRFSCRERRVGVKGQFDAQVTCTRGRARVWHVYSQFT